MYCKVQQCALKKRKLERRKLVYSFVAGLYANPPKQTNLTRNGTVNKDVLKISIPPIDAQRCGVKEMTSGGVFSQDVEIFQKDFLDFLVLGWKVGTKGTFPDLSRLCARS